MKVFHVIDRVNLGGTARWLETLTAERIAAGDEVWVATGHVQGDAVEAPGAATMSLVRLDRLGRAVSPLGRSRPALMHIMHGHLLTGFVSKVAVGGIATSERILAAASDLVLAAGQKVRDDLVAVGIVSGDKVVVVRPGVLVEFSAKRMYAEHLIAYEGPLAR